MPLKVIAISGKMGSGKTTIANTLHELMHDDQNVMLTFKFAQPIYSLSDMVWNFIESRSSYKRPQPKDGWLLQTLGTNFGRDRISETIWAEICIHEILSWKAMWESMTRPPQQIVALIDDLRFENEFDMLSQFENVYRFRLECPTDIRKERCEAWRDDTHASEIGLDEYAKRGKFDLTLHTDGGISLNETVGAIVRKAGLA